MTNAALRLALAATVLLLAPAVARSETACETALKEVRAAGATAGPFRTIRTALFFEDGKSTNALESIFDTILPDRFHRVSLVNTGRYYHFLIIGDKGWEGGPGVAPKMMSQRILDAHLRTLRDINPFSVQFATNVTCETGPDKDGNARTTFKWLEGTDDTVIVVADSRSKLPLTLRRETRSGDGKFFSVADDVFRFDPRLKIEPPAP